jgi:hypothetical protein
MPITPRQDESQDDFISRCIRIEIDNGKSQPQAVAICIKKAEDEFRGETASVSDNTWSTEAPISVNLESYNDYPKGASENAKAALRWAEENGWGSCGTPVGKQRANQLANGENISRETIARMAAFERHRQNSDKELGDGCGRLMWLAWGGDEGIEWAQRKLEQIDKQNLSLSRVKKVLFDEDFNEDDVATYKKLGFKILVRSKRKLKKKDKKVWNKLKSVGLTEDVMLYGEVKELHKKYNFDMLMTGQDPILEHLSVMGQDYSTRRTIKEFTVNSMEEAKELELKEINNVEMKFITVRAVYFYRERPDVAPATKSGSRPFCTKLMSDGNRGYSLLEIQSLPTEHLVDMGLPPDVFLYRGGFYTLPGGVRGVDTTPFCRHEWKLEIITV